MRRPNKGAIKSNPTIAEVKTSMGNTTGKLRKYPQGQVSMESSLEGQNSF